nr:TonB-dependent receptor [Corallococcus exiguus]
MLFLVLSPTAATWAQGTLEGTVTNADGKTPGVDVIVTATSPALEGERYVITNKQGEYVIGGLPPGVYRLHFESDEFIPYARDGINLKSQRSVHIHVELLPTSLLDEPPDLYAGPGPIWPEFDPYTPTSQESLVEGFTQELASHRPARDSGGMVRSFDSGLELFPGTRVTAAGLGLNGVSARESHYAVDGLSTVDPAFGGNALPLHGSFLERLSLITSGGMPDTARATGATIDATTQTGGQRFSGSAFASWAPGALEGARSLPDTGVGASRRVFLGNLGDLGGTFSGPLVKHRSQRLTFFLGAAPTLRRVGFTQAPPSDDSVPNFPRASTFIDRRAVQVLGKLTFARNDREDLSLSFITAPAASEDFTSSTGNTQAVFPVSSTTTRTSLSYVRAFPDSGMELQARLGWLHRSLSRQWGVFLAPADWPSGLDSLEEDTAERYQASVRFQGKLPLRDEHRFKAGVDAELLVHAQRWGGLEGTDVPPGEVRPREVLESRLRSQVLGAFVQDAWTPLELLTLSAGLRYDLQQVLPDDGGPSFLVGNRVSPRLGVVWGHPTAGRLFAQYGTAMSLVPLRLVEAHSVEPASTTASLAAPSSRDLVVGTDTEPWNTFRVSATYLHRDLSAPIDSVLSSTAARDRTYDAVTVLVARNNIDSLTGLKFLLSYTWSRLSEKGAGPLRLAASPSLGLQPLGLGLPGTEATETADRPHAIKAFLLLDTEPRSGLIFRAGLAYQGESGAWMRDAPERLGWVHTVDAFVNLDTWLWNRRAWAFGLDVFNLFNFQAVTRMDAFAIPIEYQPPRQLRFQARYVF